MDLQSVSLPDWLPWWAVVALLVPVAFYLALFLLMPFSTFGLRSRLRDLELRIDALHEEIRALTLRLPERGPDFHDDPRPHPPPIPPAPREAAQRDAAPRDAAARGGFGDPMADRMLAYMRDKAQTDLQRADQQRTDPRSPRSRIEPRADARAEPRLAAPRPTVPPAPGPTTPDAALPPPAHIPGAMPESFPIEGTAPPRPPPVPTRFGRRVSNQEPDSDLPRIDWPR